jgi:hypothetical protein
MKIYRIRPDPEFYTLCLLNEDPEGLTSLFNTERKWSSWVSTFGREGPLFGVKEPSATKKGDFFGLASGVLVHDTKVADNADRLSLFQGDIEYLPGRLAETSEALLVQNVMGCYNCLDLSKSVLLSSNDGSISSVESHVFLPDRILDSTIFKIPQTRLDAIYALSGRGDEDFFKFYHENHYLGLIFDEVWSG